MHTATILLSDNPDGTVSVKFTFEPAIAEGTRSAAVNTALAMLEKLHHKDEGDDE